MPWDSFHDKVGDQPTSYARAIINHHSLPKCRALDLGAGRLRDSRYLIHEGFAQVTAVDNDERPTDNRFLKGISYVQERMETFEPSEASFDACVAANSLFYCPQESLLHVFRNVHLGLRRGGIFSCNLLNEKDVRAKEGFSFAKASELPLLLEGFRPILCEEVACSGDVAKCLNDWNLHVLVLQKT